jgi:hypothetical protein
MLMKKTLLAIFALSISIPVQAGAETKAEIAQYCVNAITIGDEQATAAAAEIIVTWKSVYNEKTRQQGGECLTAAFNGEWIYSVDESEFVPIEVQREHDLARQAEQNRLAAIEELARQAQLRVQARNRAVLEETNRACVELYSRDYVAAMTNTVCNELFFAIGLPDQQHKP